MGEGKIRVMISEKVIEELRRYFITYYSKDVWSAALRHITSVVEVIPREEITDELEKWRGKNNFKILLRKILIDCFYGHLFFSPRDNYSW